MYPQSRPHITVGRGFTANDAANDAANHGQIIYEYQPSFERNTPFITKYSLYGPFPREFTTKSCIRNTKVCFHPILYAYMHLHDGTQATKIFCKLLYFIYSRNLSILPKPADDLLALVTNTAPVTTVTAVTKTTTKRVAKLMEANESLTARYAILIINDVYHLIS
jgi:hypothetical protein